MGLYQMFEHSAERNRDKTAIVFHQERSSFGTLQSLAIEFSRALEAAGAVAQEKILILAYNSVESVAAMLGCMKCGCIVCPVNWRLSAAELSKLLAGEAYRFLIVDDRCLPLFHEAEKLIDLSQKTVVHLSSGGSISVTGKPREAAPVLARDEGTDGLDLYAIQYFTSGTTGAPKGVLHTHRSMMFYALAYSLESGWKPEDIYQTSANLFHLAGFSIFTSLFIGSTTVLFERFHADEFLIAMENEHVTRVTMVPTIISQIRNQQDAQYHDFSSLRKIISGGAPISNSLLDWALEAFQCGFERSYGSTECGCIALLTFDRDEPGRLHLSADNPLYSTGRPLFCTEVRIYSCEGKPCKTGEIGEVFVRTPFLFAGYSCGRERNITPDGFFATGDLGYLDAAGFIYLVNRKNDMIVSGGENIYPNEVERCIAEMDDHVLQVAVVGVADPVWGQIVAAFIVRKPGSELSEEDVIEHCRKRIAGYKKPRLIRFLDRIPENSNGKADRKKLELLLNTDKHA